MHFIDNVLNKITMYRLVLYTLIFLVLAAFPLSLFKMLPFTPTELLYSIITILGVSFITNRLFAWAYKAPTNIESVYITALILVLIVTPKTALDPMLYLVNIAWVAAIAMASKYLLAVNKKHIFNPAAIAVVITTYTIGMSPSWWVGTTAMTPFVLFVGFLIVRKIRRTDLVLSFIFTTFAVALVMSLIKGIPFTALGVYKTLFNTTNQIIFLAVFMLTEPLTTPPVRILRIAYGCIVGLLFIPTLHLFSIYITPELALVLGNIFSYLVSPKDKLILSLGEKIKVATDTYEFSFPKNNYFSYKPGQYMEWTLPHRDTDSRGNRRYFTLASSPTEDTVKLGIKFYPEPSSFKNKLLALKSGEIVTASQCAGDFILPKDTKKKLVFIAGGIGVTPFRSMIKYCLDSNERRDIVLLYSNKSVLDIAYKEIFDEAESKLGIKTLYALTDKDQIQNNANIRLGFIDGVFIEKEIPDFKERIFYVSGPHMMVDIFEKTLKNMGISGGAIKTDFFPGFA